MTSVVEHVWCSFPFPVDKGKGGGRKSARSRRKAGNIAYGGHGQAWKNTDPRRRMGWSRLSMYVRRSRCVIPLQCSIGNNKLLRAKREQEALRVRSWMSLSLLLQVAVHDVDELRQLGQA